jgi:signal transduction histidine kinase
VDRTGDRVLRPGDAAYPGTLSGRQRIAGDLQHTVIRDLFALGLSLQAIAARIANRGLNSQLSDQVDELDGIIRDVRSAVFALDPRADRPQP